METKSFFGFNDLSNRGIFMECHRAKLPHTRVKKSLVCVQNMVWNFNAIEIIKSGLSKKYLQICFWMLFLLLFCNISYKYMAFGIH